jgi:PAS domain S-box-containing protein
MGALMRAHDWSASPMGPPETWPQSFCSALSTCLNSKAVSAIYWGPEFRLFYNDGYRPLLDQRHPWALGRPMHEIWPTPWQALRASALAVFETGQGVVAADQRLMLDRGDGLLETYWYYSFAPIRDEKGQIGGIFLTALETTARVLSEGRRASEHARLSGMFEQAPGFMAMLRGPDHVFELVNGAYRQLIGHRDVIRAPLREALPEIEGQGFLKLLDTVYESGEAFTGRAMPVEIQRTPGAPVERRFVDLIYQPITGADGSVTGIFVQGSDVTEQKLSETELRESEARFRLMADAVPQIVWITDRHGSMEFLNRRFVDYTGAPYGAYEPADMAAKFIHAEDGAKVVAGFEEALRTSEPFEMEHRIRSAAGEDRWFLARAQPHRDPETNEIVRWFGVSVDIHDRKAAEARLALSEEQLRHATDIGEIGEWDVDNLTGDMFWPPRVKAMFGISPDVPVTLDDFHNGVHPDDQEATRTAYESASDPALRALYDVEYRTIGREDGLIRWVAAKGRGLFDADGVCFRVLGTAIDITARKADEYRLRELNDQLEREVTERTAERNRVWEMSRELLAVAGFDGRLRAVNPAWESTLGHDAATTLTLPSRDQFHADDLEAVQAVMARLGHGETVERFECRVRHADGSWRWISWTLVPEGAEFYAVGRDVTAERKAAAELEQAQEALRQSQKMEAMGSLTGGVAHDFNNLLTPIVGSLDLLQRRGIGGEREQRLIAGAIQSADRAKTLVQRLLAFARRQPLQASAVDVGGLVTGMADLVASTSGPQIKVVVDAADNLRAAKADPNQLEMALLNLGVNARDAMPDGGTLRITADCQRVDAKHRSGLRPGDYICLSVADTGIGMDEATQKRAVEPFFSTKGVGKGTGLGLSMAHGLASQLGGALTIRSRPGLGTNVELWLPLSDAPVQASKAPAVSPPVESAKGIALLVDDEELVRMSTADMLADLGFAVIEAGSAEEALRLLESGASADLLVTDHLMPGLNGTELARIVQSSRPELRILIVSGYAETEGVDPDLPRLTKPFRSADLAAKLSEMEAEA